MCFMITILQCIEDKSYLNEQLSFIELCLLLCILGYFKMHMPGETFCIQGLLAKFDVVGNKIWPGVQFESKNKSVINFHLFAITSYACTLELEVSFKLAKTNPSTN